MPNSNWKGHIAELKAETRAFELGYLVSKPTFGCRYDLLFDDGHKLYRVQVKYANGSPSSSAGSVRVNLSYETRGRKNIYTYSDSEVDVLVVYIPKVNKLCWFPSSIFVNKHALSIRLETPLNNQRSGIIFADDYLW